MQVSMHNWMRAEPIETTIRRLARYGYDSIEISGEPEKYDTREVRKLLKDQGLKCWGSVTLMLADRDLLARDEQQRQKSVQYVKDCITMVKELGGVEITIVPSTVGKIQPQADPDEEWQWAIDSLKQCYEHGQKEGVRLALEPLNRFETYFLNRHDQALLLAQEVGDECGVCLDAFHINIEEADPFQAILKTGDRLVDFHVADTNRMACGQGHWDWEKLINTLKQIGYDGALTVEFVAPVDRTPANPYKNALETGEVELTPEELKFIEDHGSSTLSDEFYSWLVEESIKTLKKYM
ncbi:MAG TPA: sugar phosphate isomerase/epimerase family protein [Acidobacteriota bacterium]|nr:sugar phosphate isomerase/epimerase family protein [Acidobacteriota bacterium]